MNDRAKQVKLWNIVLPRLILLMPDIFPVMSCWAYDYLRKLIEVSELRFYGRGETVDMSAGAIILSGTVKIVTKPLKLGDSFGQVEAEVG